MEFLKAKKCWAAEEKSPEILEKILRNDSMFENHFLVASTGTSSSEITKSKYIVHEISNFLKVIESQIEFFQLNKADRFLCPLPATHIAYIALKARAVFLGAYFEELAPKWDASKFAQKMKEEKFSFSSLVPTQVFDLVEKGIEGPGLENHQVLVGGAAITEQLISRAKKLGWCLLRSYGASEFGSACAVNKKSDFMRNDFSQSLLTHFEYGLTEEGLLKLKGEGLFQSYLFFDTKFETYELQPNVLDSNGFFLTEDLVVLEKNKIQVKGRGSRFLIRNGENIFLQELESKISDDLEMEVVVLKTFDERQGEVPVLVLDEKHLIKIEKILSSQSKEKSFDKRNPLDSAKAYLFEKLQGLQKIQRPAYMLKMPIKKADTGKILYAKMQDSISDEENLELFAIDWPQ